LFQQHIADLESVADSRKLPPWETIHPNKLDGMAFGTESTVSRRKQVDRLYQILEQGEMAYVKTRLESMIGTTGSEVSEEGTLERLECIKRGISDRHFPEEQSRAIDQGLRQIEAVLGI
jgi:hypothetical protein